MKQEKLLSKDFFSLDKIFCLLPKNFLILLNQFYLHTLYESSPRSVGVSDRLKLFHPDLCQQDRLSIAG